MNNIISYKIAKYAAIIFIALFISETTLGQTRDTLLVRSVIKHGLNDSKEYLISPARWKAKDWVLAGSVTAATGALIAWGDQPIYDYTNTLHNNNRDVFFKLVQPMGNNYLYATISAFAVAGLISKNNYTFETGLIAAESYVMTGVACQFVKTTAGRARPNDYNTTNSHQWAGPFFKGNSFFSGHTSSAFAVASVIAWRYKETAWVPVLSYSLATLSGMQRIYDNRHWASDVVMGAAVGTVTGIFLCKQWEKNSIKFFPTFSPNGGGISMVIPIN